MVAAVAELAPRHAAPARSLPAGRPTAVAARGETVAQSRRDSVAVWLASTRPDGSPHLLPLWYAWDGYDLIVLSKPQAQKVRNLRRDPRVVLAFGSTERGMDVDIVEGRAEVLRAASHQVVAPSAFRRYEGLMAGLGLDFATFFDTYSQPIRIRLARRLDWGGPGWSRAGSATASPAHLSPREGRARRGTCGPSRVAQDDRRYGPRCSRSRLRSKTRAPNTTAPTPMTTAATITRRAATDGCAALLA